MTNGIRHKTNWDIVESALAVLDMCVAEGSALRVPVDMLMGNLIPKIAVVKSKREAAREYVNKFRAEHGRTDKLSLAEKKERTLKLQQVKIAKLKQMIANFENQNQNEQNETMGGKP